MLYIPVVAGRGKSTWGAFVREDPELIDGGLFTLSDALNSPEITAGLSDAFVFADSLVGDRAVVALSDTVVWVDTLGGNLDAGTLADAVVWHDELGWMAFGALDDAMAWVDVLTAEFSTPSLVDSVAWADVLGADFDVPTLLDSVLWLDTLTSTLALSGELNDVVLWTDVLSNTGTIYRVTVVNADTGAVSEFVFSMPIFGIAQLGGNLYVASGDGLYTLDASTDEEDVSVQWEMATGFTTLGTDERKRVRDLNILGRSDVKTVVKVTTARVGDKVEDWFLMQSLNRISARDGVVKIGQGIASVYWEIGVAGTGPTEIDQLKVAVLPLARRH